MNQAVSSERQLRWLADRAEIDGDTARTRSHYFATHVAGDGAIIRQAGGRYDCTLRRTERGWRFTRVTATSAWRTGPGLASH